MENFCGEALPESFHFARENRKVLTLAEQLLWKKLRNRRLNGLKFRRQHPIADFIADFFCAECNLVVEIDGGYHLERSQKQYDDGRTYELEQLGIMVIRFTNVEVINDMHFVLKEIGFVLTFSKLDQIDKPSVSPHPGPFSRTEKGWG